MSVATQERPASGYLQRAPNPNGLAEVVDLILDKGLVIDAYVRVSLVGIAVPEHEGALMAVATRGTSSNYLQRAPSPSGLADVLDVILDKGLVIDAYVRVSVIGIEVVTIDARIVIASVDTYLRFAEAVNRLDLTQTEAAGLAELRGDNNGSDKGKGMIEGAKEAFSGDGKEKAGSRSEDD